MIMIKKMIAYLKLIHSGIYQNQELSYQKGKIEGMMAVFGILYFIIMVGAALVGIRIGLFNIVYFVLLSVPILFSQRIRGLFFRTLPVSDKFAVASILFFSPIMILIPVFLFIGGCGFLWFGFLSDGLFYYLQKLNLSSLLIGLLLALAMWYLCCAGSFHRNTVVRIIWYIVIIAVSLVFILGSVNRIHQGDYQGQLSVLDIIGYYPARPALVVSISLLLVSGVFAFQYSTYLLRHDFYGQRTNRKKETIETEDSLDSVLNTRLSQMSPQERKKLSITTVLVACASCGFVILFVWAAIGSVFGGGDDKAKVNLEYNLAADYHKWETIEDDIELGEDLRWSNLSNVVFPDEPMEANVEYYHAGINGSFAQGEDGGWSDLHYYRVLVQNLSGSDYLKEKERVAGITYTYKGEEKVRENTNGVLKDTEHFSGETYIAVFDSVSECYEYAIFNDEKQQVIYLYGISVNPSDYAKDYEVTPKVFSPVITLENANADNVSYSIYSFYQVEDGYYEEDY